MSLEVSNKKDFPCPIRHSEIVLGIPEKGWIGTISRQPLPETWLQKDLSNPEATGKIPVYLETEAGDSFCVYPIHFDDPPKAFAPENIFKSEVRSLPNLFGKPTQLDFLGRASTYSAIYDPEQGYFYAPETYGKKLYLIGDSLRFYLFIEGIQDYAAQLIDQWKTNPESFVPKKMETPKTFDLEKFRRDSMEAWQEIWPFLGWLRTEDPEPAANIAGLLRYAGELPDPEAYAYFNLREDRIYFGPVSIQWLRNGDYAGVAHILAHERQHRENYRLGLAQPSIEMMERAAEIFISQLSREDSFFAVFHELAFPDLVENIYRSHLPLQHEEELSAYAAGLSYSENKNLKSPIAREESFWMIDELAQDLHNFFPYGWAALAAEYFHLANSSYDDSIHRYLEEDFQERLQCSYRRTSCGETSAWKSLERYLQSSH